MPRSSDHLRSIVEHPQRPLGLGIAAGLLFLLVAASGCGGPDTKPDSNGHLNKVLRGADRYPTEGLIVVKADLNGDTIPDVYSIYKEHTTSESTQPSRKLVRKEVDVNFDGAVDIWRHYSESEKLAKEELDYNFDGRVDAVNYFDKGKLVRKELDVEFDQAPDVFKFYKSEVLIRIERDTNNDGRVDFWEYYERGVLDRIGKDNNGDGRVDTWQER